MIHDLDLALALMNPHGADFEIENVKAERRDLSLNDVPNIKGADALSVCLKFAQSQAQFQSSRIATERARTMTIVYPSGRVFIDFLQRRFDNETGFALNADFSETDYGKDPLGASVARFVMAIHKQASPLCSGRAGAAAVQTAELIDSLSGF